MHFFITFAQKTDLRTHLFTRNKSYIIIDNDFRDHKGPT